MKFTLFLNRNTPHPKPDNCCVIDINILTKGNSNELAFTKNKTALIFLVGFLVGLNFQEIRRFLAGFLAVIILLLMAIGSLLVSLLRLLIIFWR